jgi:hypothetical protein
VVRVGKGNTPTSRNRGSVFNGQNRPVEDLEPASTM